jgi:broad specificity polyphosphatase/5'/3'-nucleotidase SurE
LDAALNKDSGQYEWGPKALRVFEIEHPQPGGDVAAIKAGHVSVTPLDCGFAAGSHVQALQGDALDESRSAMNVSTE